MILIPALGSEEMQAALKDEHVRKIVNILLSVIEQDIFKIVALLLKQNSERATPGFSIKLQALRRHGQNRSNAEGLFVSPLFIEELVQAIEALYEQDTKKVGYLRGAIVELLAYKLIYPRCENGECFGNYRFVDRSSRYSSDQVDVAILSENRKQIEGYGCKIKSTGIMSVDCTNLTALAAKAQELDYQVNVGLICFDNSNIIMQRIKSFPLDRAINAYGLDNILMLQETPFQ